MPAPVSPDRLAQRQTVHGQVAVEVGLAIEDQRDPDDDHPDQGRRQDQPETATEGRGHVTPSGHRIARTV